MIDGILRQSTAVTVKSKTFRDRTDAVTAESGLTIQKTNVRLDKNGGTMAAASADQGSSDVGAPYDALGKYDLSLNTTDTNTLGLLDLTIDNAAALPIEMRFLVVPANIWDSWFSTDLQQVDLQQWIGTAPLSLTSQRVEVLVGAMANNVMTAAASAADLVTELQSGLATAAALATVDDFVDTEIASIISTLSTISGYLDTEVAAILAAVDTEVAAIKAVTDALPDAGALTSLATQASVNTIDDFLDTEIAAIKAKTDNLPTDPADQSLIIAATDAIKADTAAILEDTGTTLPASLSTMDGKLNTIDDFLDTEIASIISSLSSIAAYIDTEVAAIKAKTDNLPTDPADQSAVEAAIAALNNISGTDVLTQVNAGLDAAISELGAVPSATPSMRAALMFLFMNLRNRTDTTASAETIKNSAGSTIATAALSDDGVTFSKAKFS